MPARDLPKPSVGDWGSGFGWRTLPDGTRNFHNGRDLTWFNRDPEGSQKVFAPIGGRVVVGWNSLIGNFVSLPIGDGYSTRLCHFSSVAVTNGQTVTRGQYLGRMGNTGSQAFGVHLHVDVFGPTGVRVDPALYYTNTFVSNLAPAALGTTPITDTQRKAHPSMYFMRTLDGTIYLVTPAGMVGIASQSHLALLQRLVNSYPSWDTFNAAERDIILGYLHGANTADDAQRAEILNAVANVKATVDTAAIIAAVGDAIASQGVEVDLAPVLAAIQSVNDNIDDQPTQFTVTPK